MGKTAKDKRDIYYRLAKQKQLRSRSSFKLLQILEFFPSLKDSSVIIDLCAAPGGWCQVMASVSKEECQIVAVDLQLMAPLPKTTLLEGDITAQATIDEILSLVKSADLVLCDGAPDVTGKTEFDIFVQNQLVISSLATAVRVLRPEGAFVSKLYRGFNTNKTLSVIKQFFQTVVLTKPRACRNASPEVFLVGLGFNMPDVHLKQFEQKASSSDQDYLNDLAKDESIEEMGIVVKAVGSDEFDSDKSYQISENFVEPIQKPINPPYKDYVEQEKGKKRFVEKLQ